MLNDSFKWMNLQSDDWGEVKLLVPKVRQGDPWGVISTLKGTIWGDQIPTVSGPAFSDAMRGSATRLMREIGPLPKHLNMRISDSDGVCRYHGSCPLYRSHCRPGKKLPDCYEPPGEWTPQESMAITQVALAWSEGRYVVVVEGDEW